MGEPELEVITGQQGDLRAPEPGVGQRTTPCIMGKAVASPLLHYLFVGGGFVLSCSSRLMCFLGLIFRSSFLFSLPSSTFQQSVHFTWKELRGRSQAAWTSNPAPSLTSRVPVRRVLMHLSSSISSSVKWG